MRLAAVHGGLACLTVKIGVLTNGAGPSRVSARVSGDSAFSFVGGTAASDISF